MPMGIDIFVIDFVAASICEDLRENANRDVHCYVPALWIHWLSCPEISLAG